MLDGYDTSALERKYMCVCVYERIERSKLQELIVTDSIPLKKESRKIRVVSCAELFADVMQRVHQNRSISSKFIM